jgi:hypothetical protein
MPGLARAVDLSRKINFCASFRFSGMGTGSLLLGYRVPPPPLPLNL